VKRGSKRKPKNATHLARDARAVKRAATELIRDNPGMTNRVASRLANKVVPKKNHSKRRSFVADYRCAECGEERSFDQFLMSPPDRFVCDPCTRSASADASDSREGGEPASLRSSGMLNSSDKEAERLRARTARN